MTLEPKLATIQGDGAVERRPDLSIESTKSVSEMKNLLLLVLLCFLCGCAHEYVMKLSNGVTLTTASKPKLKGSYYYYKGPKGEEQVIPQSRVLEIEPASMAEDENKFKPSEPKKKKWYWPF